jgi:hypothetical protein
MEKLPLLRGLFFSPLPLMGGVGGGGLNFRKPFKISKIGV